MKIDDPLIFQLEELARLELSPGERRRLRSDLQAILNMIDRMNELDTDGVEPLAHLRERGLPMRDDLPEETWSASRATSSAAVSHDGYFVVPRVIDPAGKKSGKKDGSTRHIR